ncbi:MAG: hypothetical protein J07HQW2_00202 [Haloquadratum walsbyi J07HQW2]|uniref:Uncharacterized protein n=1 Tax=Haloquadratum walsbyi J07HQW2 TaxID=1238425 RepID=U1NAX3_9EURY|nr:MAG: hypothetical protein J07HQW2_00202 [Haloquadratum walsbyi J07HQW2]
MAFIQQQTLLRYLFQSMLVATRNGEWLIDINRVPRSPEIQIHRGPAETMPET